VFDHLTSIIRGGKAVDEGVVASAAIGVLRLCQRLLPYKPDAAEPLLRGLQLVPALNPEVRRKRTNGGWRAVWWGF
jgi:brefeldin A-resistance guanine nucleotide exchange factor 1